MRRSSQEWLSVEHDIRVSGQNPIPGLKPALRRRDGDSETRFRKFLASGCVAEGTFANGP